MAQSRSRAYIKILENLSSPGPTKTFVFLEENMCSLNDGYLQVRHNQPVFPDVPGSYHEWGCGFSFADGHAEMRKWVTSVLRIPVKYDYQANSIGTGFTNPDWKWYTERAACPQPAQWRSPAWLYPGPALDLGLRTPLPHEPGCR